MDERIHVLVGYGSHGKHEKVQDLGKKFTVQRDTVLYRLKTHSEKVVQALGTDGRRGRYLDVREGDGDRGGEAVHVADACGDARRETAWGFLPGNHLSSHPNG